MLRDNYIISEYKKHNCEERIKLCHEVLGPGQFVRTAYRLRETYLGSEDFSLCVFTNQSLIGSITFTPVKIGKIDKILLLGPLVVKTNYSGKGIGSALITAGISKAAKIGYKLVILVGDKNYYGKMGFDKVDPHQIAFPGPVDQNRILAYELENKYLEKCYGKITS